MISIFYTPDGEICFRCVMNPLHHTTANIPRELTELAEDFEKLGIKEIQFDPEAEVGKHHVISDARAIRVVQKEDGSQGQPLPLYDLAYRKWKDRENKDRKELTSVIHLGEVSEEMRRAVSWRICRGKDVHDFII